MVLCPLPTCPGAPRPSPRPRADCRGSLGAGVEELGCSWAPFPGLMRVEALAVPPDSKLRML